MRNISIQKLFRLFIMPRKYNNSKTKISDLLGIPNLEPQMDFNPRSFMNEVKLPYNSSEESNDDFESTYFHNSSMRKNKKKQTKKGTYIYTVHISILLNPDFIDNFNFVNIVE